MPLAASGTGAPHIMSWSIEAFATFAAELADASGQIARRYYRAGVSVDTKADDSPVTQADREAEACLREMITARFPDHGIIGEEFGSGGTDREFVWILDPIDGTKAFITGRPTFGTLIGLLHHGVPILGVIDHPALHERWIGAAGLPTRFQGAPVRTRPCADLADAILANTAPEMFTGDRQPAFERLRQAVKLPIYGGDCHNYGLLASGYIDVAVDATMAIYDFLPLVPVVNGAGGAITDWQGNAMSLDSDDRVIAVGDRRLLAPVLALLAG